VERVYVHEAVYDKFVALLADKTRALRHGPERGRCDVDMGSMTTEEQMKTVSKQVDAAVAAGAKIIAQSSSTESDAKGYFYPATLMTHVDHSMELMREETFGPVVPVMKFSTVEQALELANDSTMALTSSVWTTNLSRGKEIACRLHSGVTTINDHLYTHGMSETPWGGWKESGMGRTHSALGLDEMTQPKLVNWDLLPVKRNLWWYPFDQNTYDGMLSALRMRYPTSFGGFISDSIKVTKLALSKMFSAWTPKLPNR
jgi:succinate-semialdehyde dehydrogenase/glutarate-semialdehyde dehydrogenase